MKLKENGDKKKMENKEVERILSGIAFKVLINTATIVDIFSTYTLSVVNIFIFSKRFYKAKMK